MLRMKKLAIALTHFVSLYAAAGDDAALKLYSACHYQADEDLHENFTRKTGIRISRIDGGEQALLARILNKGEYSLANVLITVDAARLALAEACGVVAPVESEFLKARLPAHLRSSHMFAYSILPAPSYTPPQAHGRGCAHL